MKKTRIGVGSGPWIPLRKMLIFMKFLWIILLSVCLSVQAEVYSQQTKVTLDMQKTSLTEVLKELSKQTKLDFLYNFNLMKTKGEVSVNVKNREFAQVLDDILPALGLEYTFDSQVVVIRERPSLQQTTGIVVTGRVTDEKGEPLPGVTILIKETRTGTISDGKGNFTLRVTKDTDILVFSFIGMKTQEVPLNKKTTLQVIMEEEVSGIDEVVVTGIYERKKESFTGSSITFTEKELKMVGNQNVLQSLKTLDPSFAIIENNEFGSDPNRLPDIEVRGKSSVVGLTAQYGTDPNQPLFILDGFEASLSVISDLSMDRVENITLLKDAAATAIYGSKAANGVVVVETKRPLVGQLRVNYNLNLSFNFADLSDYNLMNAAEKLKFERLAGYYGEIDENGNIISETQETTYDYRMKEIQRGVDSYWMKEPLRFATTHKHTLFVSGGDENIRYGISLSYGDTQGVMKESNREVVNGNFRLSYRKNRLSFTNSLSVDYTMATRERVPFSSFSRSNPYLRKYNENGSIKMIMNAFDEITFGTQTQFLYNPLYDMNNNNINQAQIFGFTNNFEMIWRIFDELQLRGRVGIQRSAEKGETFRSPFNSEFAGADFTRKGSYSERNTQSGNYTGEVSLTYGKLLDEVHMINVVSGLNFEQRKVVTSGYRVLGFVDDDFANPAFAMGYPQGETSTYQDSKRRSASYYLNAGYGYDRRYLLEANFRSDGSSVYGSSRQFTTTWSVGLGWNMHNESFFEDIVWVNLLKLRASIGNPGNQNFDDYMSTQIFRYNTENRNPFGPSVILSAFGDDQLKWQKTLDRNIGVDLVVLQNRLRVNVDYFNKKTDPLLVYIGIPSSAGATSIPRNLGKQITKGFTLSTNYTILRQEEMNWSLNANMRHLKSEYRDINDALDQFNKENKGRNLVRYYDGASPSDLWAVRSVGIDPATGREIFLNKNNKQTFVHSYDDEVIVGNSDPDVEGVIGSSLYYKGFSASINLRYRVGGQLFMRTLFDKVENISTQKLMENQDKRALYDRWQQPGDVAKFRAISLTEVTQMSSRFVKDNNILAGESFSLGYETAEAKWLKSVGASSMTARVYMNDIFRLSTVKDERGIDYPFARSVSFSFGVRF